MVSRAFHYVAALVVASFTFVAGPTSAQAQAFCGNCYAAPVYQSPCCGNGGLFSGAWGGGGCCQQQVYVPPPAPTCCQQQYAPQYMPQYMPQQVTQYGGEEYMPPYYGVRRGPYVNRYRYSVNRYRYSRYQRAPYGRRGY